MDARGCKGCNAKEKGVCWSAFLEQPTAIRELTQCPDPVLNTLDKLDKAFESLENIFGELAKERSK